MSHADEVRSYCRKRYVEPARNAGDSAFSIRAGDVHDALGYKSRMPLVCSAIGTEIFTESNQIKRVIVEGPLNGASTTFFFQFL